MAISLFKNFIKLESSGGAILFIAAIFAFLISNTSLNSLYHTLLYSSFIVQLNGWKLNTTLNSVINNGLMTVFFLLVSLEIKRELVEGELNTRKKALLPLIAAIGGMICPALIYVALNFHDAAHLSGWAIPTATDIAFSLAILSLLGSRIPNNLKIFLTAIAIIDDLGAIIIIALFYTSHIAWAYLFGSLLCMFGLILLNTLDINRFWPYAIIGFVLWIFISLSGVHATIAGVLLGLAIPIKTEKFRQKPLLPQLEHTLHPWVARGILPLFAFANAGLSLRGLHFSTLLNPIPLGILLGLFLGKQTGIFSACWLAIKMKAAVLPEKIGWREIYGTALICGIGFTMSLFIGTLAFSDNSLDLVRLGVLSGSFLSGTLGYVVLRMR